MIKQYQNTERIPTANSTYPKVAVQWLNQALCFYQSLCFDSEVLRYRRLRVAAKRYKQSPILRHEYTLYANGWI
jgi:hypothetical protein